MSDQAARQSAKVFIGGLSWETTGEKLRAYFENYGVVREAFVSYNRNNGRPRGFGFVVFECPDVADKVVASKHTINRREVEAKKAVPKDDTLQGEEAQQSSQLASSSDAASTRSKKIFVGGLAPSVDDKALRSYFEQFGAVEDAVVMYDHDKRPRGFGFVTFASEESVEAVFAKGAMQSIQDKQIEIKAAVPRDLMPPSTRGQHAMFLDPRFAGPRSHHKGPHEGQAPQHAQFSNFPRGGPYGPRNFAPTMQQPGPGHFNGGAGMNLQGLPGGDNMPGKAPPGGGFDLYSGMNGNMFGPNSRAALAYNLASLQAQAHLNGMQSTPSATGKITAGALGPGASNSLNLKALALAGGFGPAFPNGLGNGSDSGGYQDAHDSGHYQQHQQPAPEFTEASSNTGLAVGTDFNYHDAAFSSTPTPGWSS